MNSCKICGKPLTTTPEYDMCIECQGEQFKKLTMPYMSGRTSNTSKVFEMTPKENIVSKARASISWIYSNLLGRKANIQLLSENQRQVIEDEYVSWVSYLLPIEQALTELERLKVFKQTFDNYELAKKQDFIAYENWQECEKELEELKRDVKRYFELSHNPRSNTNPNEIRPYIEWAEELIGLEKQILSKLGKENEW